MNILPFQSEIAERMLVNTENESIHADAQFMQTANGYWIAWHDGVAALLAPNTPPDVPCFWVEGAESLAELVKLAEQGDFDEVDEFDGDDEAWHHAAQCCGHEHDEHEHACCSGKE
ncbi:MAG: general secretion pathway protein GspG [Neisseria sp.]|nr:general secretion pathway protein GspG [Neisseria sp.]